jgi:eukaryotic-like serine/threonine-protein kinase
MRLEMDPQALRVGQVVGEKYRLVRLLGEGGMGSVYEARHDVIGRRFAVKFLHAELAGHPEILARFRREAQAAGSLENENIAAVTDFGSSPDGAPYIVMEFLEGEDLAKTLARHGPMQIPRAAHILIQVCRGLVAAHGRGIVHRDLKPENLLLQKRGDGGDLVKILDFGIAKLKSTEHRPEAATRTGITLGTPYYMPPEQARGQKELDERADIYALGVILFELLSGQKPHNGENYNAILYSILMGAAPRIEAFRPDLPPELANVVHRAMAGEAKDRYQSVSELAQALAPFAGRALTPAPTLSNASTVMAPHSVGAQSVPAASHGTRAPVVFTPPPTSELGAPKTSRAGLWAGLAIALLGAAGAAAWFAMHSAPAAPDSTAAAPPVVPLPTPSVAVVATAAPAPTIAPTPALPPVASAQPTPSPAAPPQPPARPVSKPAKLHEKPAPAPVPPPVAAPAPAKPAAPAQAPRPRPDDDLFAP